MNFAGKRNAPERPNRRPSAVRRHCTSPRNGIWRAMPLLGRAAWRRPRGAPSTQRFQRCTELSWVNLLQTPGGEIHV